MYNVDTIVYIFLIQLTEAIRFRPRAVDELTGRA